MDGQAGDLPRQVPERDIDSADRAEGDAPAALPHGVPEAPDIERVLTHHDGLQVGQERLCVHGGVAAGGAEEGVSLQTLVGADGEHAHLAFTPVADGGPGIGPVGHGPAEGREEDIVDFHISSLRSVARLLSRSLVFVRRSTAFALAHISSLRSVARLLSRSLISARSHEAARIVRAPQVSLRSESGRWSRLGARWMAA